MNKRAKKISLITLVLLALIVLTVGFIFISNALSKKVNASTSNESVSVEKDNVVALNEKSLSSKSVVAAETTYPVYSLTFVDGNETLIGKFVLDRELPALEIAIPQKNFYSFLGFFKSSYDEEGNKIEKQYYDENLNIVGDFDFTEQFVTLYAKWEGITVKITFDRDDGWFNADTAETCYVQYGEKVQKIDSPVRNGYAFDGYYFNEIEIFDKYGYFVDEISKIENDITIKAKWIIETYKIKVVMTNINVNGELPAGVIPTSYTINDVARESIDFEQISKGNYRINFRPRRIEKAETGEKTVYATWVEKYTIVDYRLGGGKNNVDNIEDFFDQDNNIVVGKKLIKLDETLTLSEPTKIGHVFAYWTLDGEQVTEVTCCDSEKITLVAVWQNRIAGYEYIMSMDTSYISTSGHSSMTIKLPVMITNSSRSCTIAISPDTNSVHIFAETYSSYALAINITSRNTDFNLYLENCQIIGTMLGTSSLNTISMATTNKSKLNLYAYGKVAIKGASPSQNPYGNGLNGSHAIKCSSLHIKHADILGIYGGNASRGASGYSNGSPATAIYIDEKFYLPYYNENLTIAGGYFVGGNSQAGPFIGGTLVFVDEYGNIVDPYGNIIE